MTPLSPAKQALLAKWARGGGGMGEGGDPGIARREPGSGPAPLSFVQERQLFLELLEPATAVNNLCVCVRIEGPLDLPLLQRSAGRLLARHDVLRTSFDDDQGRPRVRIDPPSALTIDLGVVDLRDQDGDRLTEALRLAELDARQPVDLTRAPLLRVKTFRLGRHGHILLVVIHHTIADGWSLGVFLRELFSEYQRLQEGSMIEPPPPPIQYGDFAAWQRQSLCGAKLERLLAYWMQQLGGELPVLDLPIDHPRSARQTFAGATYRFQLGSTVTDALRAVSRGFDVTPFMTLVAAFQTLLHRHCRQDDILVGTPTAGRTRPETEALIGAFINTLVLRTDLSGDPSFGELLGRVREVALLAYAHQELPFERLVAELRPQRDLSRTPLFQVMFNLQTPLPAIRIAGLSLELLPIERGAAQFDLTLIMTESPDGLAGTFEYNADLFDPATIARLAESFQLLLANAIAHPERRLSHLAVMSDVERERLVVGLNDTRADYPADSDVYDLFAGQVERTPDAVAVRCGPEALTYRDLERRASALAAELQRLECGPGAVVGVMMDRSVDLLVSLLAVLKAGCAYLPIDPSTPAERVSFMLRDGGAHALLTGGPIAVDRIDAPGSGENHRVGVPSAAERLAYVIYTSGSTGEPKGVRVRQRALVNLLWFMRQALGLGPGEALLALTSVAFDIAALELYLPLITGATVVLATADMAVDRRKLQRAIAAHRIRMVQATPTMWSMLLEGDWPGEPDLVALSGGEPLPPELAERLLQRVGSLWNVYGPTETTVWSTAGRVRRGQRPMTIGRPIANTQVYVLDANLQPVPVGATGELCIGGDGVSPGYVNRPELTAERFIPNPFQAGARDGDRLFRTGDLARYRPDGSIELLGRLDDQVKIHGFRIELGEVEAALRRHPALRACAVVARDTGRGDKRLVAYVVPSGETPPDARELRAFLRTTLPAYMVPGVFVSLPDLPLNIAGKIDRRALPAAVPDPAGPAFAAPRTPLERRLAGIYAQVLGVERIGIHDNFFDLGGGSIQILEIIVRAQADGIRLAPETFFEHQTVSALAEFVDRGNHDDH